MLMRRPHREEYDPDYDGDLASFAGLVIKTTILTVLTLGIYRFWAKNRIRRYIWGHISFLGERFEYSGLGRELFLGFLIVLGIFAGLTITKELLILALAGTSQSIEIAANAAYIATLVFLLPVAQYRARRYQLSRTQWRGVRGGQSGSSARYGAVAFGFRILGFLTYGLITPLVRTNLFARRMTNTWFGDRRFGFDGSAAKLYPAWLIVWLLDAAAMALVAYAVYLSWNELAQYFMDALTSEEQGGGTENIDFPALDVPWWIFLVAPMLWVASWIAYVRYRVFEYRYLAGATSFENLRFESSLSAWSVVGIYLLYALAIGGMVIGIIVVMGVIGVMGGGSIIAPTEFEYLSDMGTILIMLVFLIVGPVLRYLLVVNRMARLVCETLAVKGSQDFDAILQSSQSAPRRGEGLADMLDVGGI